jgi:hypothetical protein
MGGIGEYSGWLGIAGSEIGSERGQKGARVLFGRPCLLTFLDKLLILYASTKSQIIW